MKNLKKFLAVIVTVAMLASFAVPVFADEMTDAEVVTTLGMIQGSGDGVTDEYLASSVTRIQAAIMFLRLKGLEAEALAYEGADNFDDADEVWAGGQAILAYLKANADLGWQGIGDNKFDPLGEMTAQAYYKVLLEALGYEYNVDFAWGNVIAFAASKGLVAVADVTEFTVTDLATATVEALKAENSDGVVLIDALVADGSVAEADAQATGLVAPTALAIESAGSIGVKTVEVKFNMAVDTDAAVVKVKKGAAIYSSSVAWNEAKDTATVTTVIDLLAADYTAVVTGLGDELTADFTVAAEAESSLEITATQVDDETLNAQIAFIVKNQYGEDMGVNGNAVTVTAYNVTKGAAVSVDNITGGQYVTIDTNTGDDTFATGDVIRFTMTYKGMTTQANVTVVDPSSSAAIELGGIVLADDDTMLNESDGTVKLAYTLLDQYGNAADLTATGVAAAMPQTLDGVQFITSDDTVIDDIQIVDDADGNGEIVLSIAGAGTAIITAVVNESGAVSTATIVVNGNAAVDSVVISAPTSLVADGETVELTVVVTDQYGEVIPNDDARAQAIVFNGGSLDAEGVFTTNALAEGNFTITAGTLADADAYGTITFTVEAAAYAQEIKAIDIPTVLEVGSTLPVTVDDLTVIDQYGREYTGVLVLSEPADVDAVVDSVAANTIVANAANTGTATLRATIDGSVTFDFDVKVIGSADIKGYTIAEIGTVYAGNGDGVAVAVDAYEVAVTLNGVDANGNAVKLASTAPNFVTSSNAGVAAINGTSIDGIAAGTATISAWVDGVNVDSVTVTVSGDAPVAQSVEWTATTIADGANAKSIIKVLDQYGVDITASTAVFFAGGSEINSTGLATDADPMVDVVETITVITSNGLTATKDITIG